ncbi:hypothetical protein, conserved [Eimeria acervulina]|uniref:Uncharacterized protein n=1 Tax=Eimeria acervulina TaxID=5801 RepID=U6GNI4_EIMAC|nr:hypothetical protein, conserved [Eimeria acervulina]CDI80843.1 hypothetical protein, conserved [Eimeria acervulina]
MLNALQQQTACTLQQMQEQQQQLDQLDTQIQALTQQVQQQQQKLQEQRRVSEELMPQQRDMRNRLDLAQARKKTLYMPEYKKGTMQRDTAAALLPPFVARKGEIALERKALIKEAEGRAKQAGMLRAENETLYGYIKGDVCKP